MYIVTDQDRVHLRRELATEAADAGDQPFGSVLVSPDGRFLRRNLWWRPNPPPGVAIARWAAENLTPEDRTNCTVYTSGEHCPMCSSAHAMVGPDGLCGQQQ